MFKSVIVSIILLTVSLDSQSIGDDKSSVFFVAFDNLNKMRCSAAFTGFLKLAKKGDFEAAYYLGTIEEIGCERPINHKGALRWYRLSASKRYSRALERLVDYYIEGKHVKQDKIKALALSYILALYKKRDELKKA